jgi:hypothetical protein
MLAMTLASAVLTSCATASSDAKASLRIYQPRSLRLQAGQEIQTRDGRYSPQVDEIWHSDAAYRELEQGLINATAALAQERQRNAK